MQLELKLGVTQSMKDTQGTGSGFKFPEAVSRRTIVKSAAWSAPVMALSVAAPAASASVTATISGELDVSAWEGGVEVRGENANGDRRTLQITGTKVGSKITNLEMDLFVSIDGRQDDDQAPTLGWTGMPSDWSLPVAAEVVTIDGRKFRRYVMTYQGTVTASDPVTTLPLQDLSFNSEGPGGSGVYLKMQTRAIVDGKQIQGTPGATQYFGGLNPGAAPMRAPMRSSRRRSGMSPEAAKNARTLRG